MKRTLLERIQQIDIDPNYCMRMSEIIEIADNSRGICDAICKAFTYGYLKGQRAGWVPVPVFYPLTVLR